MAPVRTGRSGLVLVRVVSVAGRSVVLMSDLSAAVLAVASGGGRNYETAGRRRCSLAPDMLASILLNVCRPVLWRRSLGGDDDRHDTPFRADRYCCCRAGFHGVDLDAGRRPAKRQAGSGRRALQGGNS